MPWMLGAFKGNMIYVNRTPRVEGKVDYSMTPCDREQFEALIDLSEMVGRDEPLDIHSLRAILGPRALLGEVD